MSYEDKFSLEEYIDQRIIELHLDPFEFVKVESLLTANCKSKSDVDKHIKKLRKKYSKG